MAGRRGDLRGCTKGGASFGDGRGGSGAEDPGRQKGIEESKGIRTVPLAVPVRLHDAQGGTGEIAHGVSDGLQRRVRGEPRAAVLEMESFIHN